MLSSNSIQSVFGGTLCPVDGKYFTKSREYNVDLVGRGAKRIEVLRDCDIASGFRLRCKLDVSPEVAAWCHPSDILDGIMDLPIELIMGNTVFDRIYLKRCIMEQQAKKKMLVKAMPKKGGKWIVTIPLDLGVPIVPLAILYHTVEFKILAKEHIYKTREIRRNIAGTLSMACVSPQSPMYSLDKYLLKSIVELAAGEGKVDIKKMSIRSDGYCTFDECRRSIANIKTEISYLQNRTAIMEDVVDPEKLIVVSDDSQFPMSHMYIMVQPFGGGEFTTDHPIKSIELVMPSAYGYDNIDDSTKYHECDLEEANWLEDGLVPPGPRKNVMWLYIKKIKSKPGTRVLMLPNHKSIKLKVKANEICELTIYPTDLNRVCPPSSFLPFVTNICYSDGDRWWVDIHCQSLLKRRRKTYPLVVSVANNIVQIKLFHEVYVTSVYRLTHGREV